MQKSSLVFFGKLPPPYTGMTLANKSVLEVLGHYYNIHIVNYSQGRMKPTIKGWALTIFYLKQLVLAISKNLVLKKYLRGQNDGVVYFVGSASFLGNLLDVIRLTWLKDGVNVVMHVHTGNWSDNFTKFRLFNGGRYVLDKVSRLIVLSDGMKTHLSKFIDGERIYVLRNTIEDEVVCTKGELREKWSRPKEQKRILYLSNFIESKGYLLLIRALEKLQEKSIEVDFRLTMIGAFPSNTEEAKIRGLVQSSAIAERVDLIGPLFDRSAVKRVFLDSDIFCLPSFYPLEAQPLAILEAMNAGCVVVSTWHAGIPEIIDNFRNGFLVEKNSLDELIKVIEEVLTNDCRSLAIQARDDYEKYYSKDAHERIIKNIFKF